MIDNNQRALDVLKKLVGTYYDHKKTAKETEDLIADHMAIAQKLLAEHQETNAATPYAVGEIDARFYAKMVSATPDDARGDFEIWLTGNGNYPHLKHKNFGGAYINEESAMKWDGFKCGYNAALRNTQGVPREVVDEVKQLLENYRYIPSGHDEAASALCGYMEQALAILDQHVSEATSTNN